MKAEEESKPLSKVIDVEKSFNFWPYSYTSQGTPPNLFYAQSSREVLLVPRADVPVGT